MGGLSTVALRNRAIRELARSIGEHGLDLAEILPRLRVRDYRAIGGRGIVALSPTIFCPLLDAAQTALDRYMARRAREGGRPPEPAAPLFSTHCLLVPSRLQPADVAAVLSRGIA